MIHSQSEIVANFFGIFEQINGKTGISSKTFFTALKPSKLENISLVFTFLEPSIK